MRQPGADKPQVLGRARRSFHEKETTFEKASNSAAVNLRAVQKYLELADHFEAKRLALRGALADDRERLLIRNAARIQ